MQRDELEDGRLPAWLEGRHAGAVPGWLGPLVESVMHDMQLPHPVPARIAWEPASDDSGILWIWEDDESGGSGHEVAREANSDAERLCGLAWFLQDQFFPETETAWGEPRPPCPGHPHPATPELRQGEAWWICPNDQHPIARIGQLSRISP